MTSYSRSRLTDDRLVRDFSTRLSLDCNTTADLLADIGEVDFRRLYLRAAYPSMYLYCVNEFHMSEDVACKRICAARAARRFPAVFHAVAEGRLNLSAVVMLAPHLTPETADELLAAAAHKTRSKLELLLAERFHKPDVPTLVQAIPPAISNEDAVMRPVAQAPVSAPGRIVTVDQQNSTVQTVPLPTPVAAPVPSGAKLAPLSPGRFALQVSIDQETYDALRRAQELVGHAVPLGDLATVLKRAALAYVQLLEKRKFAKCDSPRPRRVTLKGRHIPAEVKRSVCERDGDRCTFVSDQGKRCEARANLEFDHIEAVARGGGSTAGNLRLRCRAHNQHAADLAFGRAFMDGRREAGRERSVKAKARRDAPTEAQAAAPAERTRACFASPSASSPA